MEKIRNILREILGEVFDVETEVEVSVAPELENAGEFRADYATNVAMKISGVLAKKTGEKKNPREVAEVLRKEFLEEIEKDTELKGTKVEVAGPGFLNFMLPDEYFEKKIGEFSEKEEDFLENISRDEYSGKKVVTEFSDPNPFKVLHIGHLYTSVVGESISRLVELAGGEVHRVNFGGDVGLHVAKTLFVLLRGSAEADGFSIEDIAKAYVEGTRLYEEDEEAKGQIVELNKKIYEISEMGEGNIGELSESDQRIADLYFSGRKLSYEYFEEFYQRIGVKFEKFYPESTVADLGLTEVKEHTPEVYEESDGAVVFKGEKYGLHTRVFINKEGLPTYEAKDVGLLFRKWADYEFDESVVITGNDIIEYMKVVLKSVEQYAPELVQRTKHLTHGNVKLPGAVKMSSRKGNFIKAVDVLDEVRSSMKNSVPEAVEATKDVLALAALKYSFLKYRVGGDIEFDVKESVSLTGNSGPYLQYSAVRAKKILGVESKAEQKQGWELNNFEVGICKKIVQYREVLGEAVRELAPHIVCNYLFELAQEFSRFYENCKVNGGEFEVERRKIVLAFLRVMESGLKLLGIEVPEEM